MTKPGCTHPLAAIKAQMVSLDAMNLTPSAQAGIRALGISNAQALKVVQSLTAAVFNKTMPSEKRPGCMQDVYFPVHMGTELYVKFGDGGPFGEYVTLSFKENDRGR